MLAGRSQMLEAYRERMAGGGNNRMAGGVIVGLMLDGPKLNRTVDKELEGSRISPSTFYQELWHVDREVLAP